METFLTKIAKHQSLADDEKPGEVDTHTGSSHPDNWQTDIQTGKSPEEIRKDALELSRIIQSWQSEILHAADYFDTMEANSDKYLHMYGPLIIKGLSREKLMTVSKICQRVASMVTVA
jgi:hypothetical protein